jgi:hypothetical protein
MSPLPCMLCVLVVYENMLLEMNLKQVPFSLGLPGADSKYILHHIAINSTIVAFLRIVQREGNWRATHRIIGLISAVA